MTAEIKQTLLRTVCGGWDRNFLESVLEQISKGRELSVKQKDILAKVLGRNGEANQVIHDNWSTEYEKGYKTHAKVLAEYHSLQPYYREMAKDILNDHVPERVKFLRMFNNKYSKKIINEYQKEPKY